MKKFIVYLLVIICTVSLGFAVFYLVRDNEIISISSASMYKDVGDTFTLDVNHINKKSSTSISITSSDDSIVSGKYNAEQGTYTAEAKKGGVARINIRTTNAKFRNLWCDVIVGDGTIESPFYISTAEQLSAIGMGDPYKVIGEDGEETVVEGVYAGSGKYTRYLSNACYKLIADIDASEVNDGYWVPLQHFNGRFDGNGLTISNIYINARDYQDSSKIAVKNAYFVEGCNAGLFASVGKDAVVYNLNLENFVAKGTYGAFGTIAGINNGTIERVEVESAELSVTTGYFGGIVGTNQSTESRVATSGEGSKVVRHIARVDRCSIHFNLGRKDNGDGTYTLDNINGIIGGVVGANMGGTIVYSYAMGDVYMGSASITYGGIVAINSVGVFEVNAGDNNNESPYDGGNIKDCYSDLRLTVSDESSLANSTIGGAIGIHSDIKNGLYEDEEHGISDNKVKGYLIGIYYNKDNLNYVQENSDIEKNFTGVAEFRLYSTADAFNTDGAYDLVGVSSGDVTIFEDIKTIVYGLTNEEMRDGDNFISHTTKSVEFNNDGESKGIVEKNVYWLFDTVWAIDGSRNDGKPYLNYQLIYVPDDFATVGTPIVSSDLNEYYYKMEITYPVTILSGADGKLRIKVNDDYQLKYSPTGISMEWSSSDENIVKVDEKTGLIHGVKAGVATVTVKTKTNYDTITVIVENIPYIIEHLPETIYLYIGSDGKGGESFDLENEIVVTPERLTSDRIYYTLTDKEGSNVAIIRDEKLLVANSVGKALLTVRVADTVATANVVVTTRPAITLSASQRTISGYIEDMTLTGTITISNSGDYSNLTYTLDNKNPSVVSASFSSSDKSKLNYTILGTGTAVVTVKIANEGYTGTLDIYFYIKSVTNVDLTLSSATITGYYSEIARTGKVTISNSAGISLSYEAKSDNESVVYATMSGNAMSYTIKSKGTATVNIKVTTPHYVGATCVHFNILEDPETGTGGDQIVEYIDLNYSSFTINKGDKLTLKASGNYSSSVTWSSNNNNVATVSGGVVTAVGVGTCLITASAGNVKATCSVTVKNTSTSYSSINISPSSATINEGSTRQLSASGSGYNYVTWGSSNSTIASVNSSGLVTALKAGTCKITAYGKDSNGNTKATATATITVTAVPTTITLSVSPSTTVNKGTIVTVEANVNKSGVNISWSGPSGSTSSGNILTIDTKSLTAKTYTVKATVTSDSTSASASFTVQDPNAYSKYITTYAQLNAMRYHLNKEFILAGNITVPSNWTPIGTCSAPFTGKFSNNGSYTINIASNVSSDHAGLFGCVKGASISGINVNVTNKLSATTYAGGIAGHAKGNSTISNCSVTGGIISTTSSTGYAGGIVGRAESSSISGCKSKATINATNGGYAGGIAGKSNSTISNCLVTSTISAPTSKTSYAGGVAGESTYKIETSTIRGSLITGYYSGGIAGSFNRSLSLTISFDVTNKGNRYADLSSGSKTVLNSSANVSVTRTAVRETTTVKGVMAGGLFGVLQSGLVTNCYTRATIHGESSSAIKGGFACDVNASGSFKNAGGTGNVGIILYCYASVKFSGSGTNFAITNSAVHNHAVIDTTRSAGYVMEYVFDDGTDGNANYSYGNTWTDNVKAKKSSSEMKSSSTYTSKNFSTTYWNLSSGYPTLKGEK